jgi:glyoxylase-like metal-dependent hydrolase (beta-lactamase superfamily II)
MIFEQIPVGGDRNFAYLIGDEESKQAAVVDPAFKPAEVLKRAAAAGLEIVYLINTHGHYDHADGNDVILASTKARLITGGPGRAADGASFSLGKIELTIIHTPGHSADSVCVLAAEPGKPGKLVTGDTLFVGKVGGTGFGDDARAEYDSLRKKLMVLPEDTEVWPGHDVGVAPCSTIGHEKRTNPFLLRETFEDFVDLKRNWLEYKKQHGIK